MRTASAKAKGRRAMQEAREMMLAWFPDLSADDIRVTPSGCTGEDLLFSPRAQAAIGLIVEGKNQEALNVWASLAQAEDHAAKLDKQGGRNGRIPALVFRRNRSKLYIAMGLEDYLSIMGVWKQPQTIRMARDCIECPGSPLTPVTELASDGSLAN